MRQFELTHYPAVDGLTAQVHYLYKDQAGVTIPAGRLRLTEDRSEAAIASSPSSWPSVKPQVGILMAVQGRNYALALAEAVAGVGPYKGADPRQLVEIFRPQIESPAALELLHQVLQGHRRDGRTATGTTKAGEHGGSGSSRKTNGTNPPHDNLPQSGAQSAFARTLLHWIRTTINDAGTSWTDDELVAARDYSLSYLFPTGLAGPKQDRVIARFASTDPDKLVKLLQLRTRSAVLWLHSKAAADRNRQSRKAAKEAVGREWDPDDDAYDEVMERIEKVRHEINEMIATERRRGKAVVPIDDGMKGYTFHKSFALAGEWTRPSSQTQ